MVRFFVISLCAMFLTTSLHAQTIIGIAGGTGSGKTTLANQISETFSVCSTLISQDAYYKDLLSLPLSERKKMNFDHPNAIDFDLLIKHIKDLKQGKSIEQPIYDFTTHSRRKETTIVQPTELIILEGILILAIDEVRDLLDLKLYIDTDGDVRMLRRIERDINERGRTLSCVKNQYLTTVKPMHEAFVEPSKVWADIIIPGMKYNQNAIDFITAKLSSDLDIQLSNTSYSFSKK